jgi:hypothetical protein
VDRWCCSRTTLTRCRSSAARASWWSARAPTACRTRPAALSQARSEAAGNCGPLIIVTILFFMWGLLTALNDVLILHLKALYTLTYVQAMLFILYYGLKFAGLYKKAV